TFARARLDRALQAVLGRPPRASSEAVIQEEQRMNQTIRREILIPQPRERVWQAITDSATLAEWMFPNDFKPRVGHHFTFRVPGNPRMVDGLVVRCEVL